MENREEDIDTCVDINSGNFTSTPASSPLDSGRYNPQTLPSPSVALFDRVQGKCNTILRPSSEFRSGKPYKRRSKTVTHNSSWKSRHFIGLLLYLIWVPWGLTRRRQFFRRGPLYSVSLRTTEFHGDVQCRSGTDSTRRTATWKFQSQS